MTIYYVNAQTGNDSNNGLSEAAPKLTIAATITAAAYNDTIRMTGRFINGFAVPYNKQLWYVGHKGCLFVPTTRRSGTCFSPTQSGNANGIFDVEVAGFQCGALVSDLCGIGDLRNVVFRDCTSGLISSGRCAPNVYDCAFENCDVGLNIASGSGLYTSAYNCSFVGCATGILGQAGGYVRCLYSYFDSLVAMNLSATLAILDANYNAYNVAGGVSWIKGATTYTTLATWQAAVSQDAASIELAGQINDGAKASAWPVANSNLLAPGVGYQLQQGYGVQKWGAAVSPNRNATLWTNGIFSNTEIDPVTSGIRLSAGQASGYWRSGVIDFGAPQEIARFDAAVDGEYSLFYATLRVRFSNTSFAANADEITGPTWYAMGRGGSMRDLSEFTRHYRYQQVEVTLTNAE